MERVRIRSMLNNIKANQLYLSARKNIESSFHEESIDITGLPHHEARNNFNHSCFTLKPMETARQQQHGFAENQQQKNCAATPKQNKKKGTKISNRAYMTINIKNKQAFQNLKELGIQTKKISGRKFRNTQKSLKLDYQLLKIINANQSDQKISKKRFLKKTLTHQSVRNRSAPPIFSELLNQKANNFVINYKEKPRIQALAQIRGLRLSHINRKNSDITPWQMQSPTMKHV